MSPVYVNGVEQGGGLAFVNGWTAAKLLRGAGVGSNPTEIGIGTGATDVAAGDHTHTLAEDITGSAKSALTGTTAGPAWYLRRIAMTAGQETDLAALSQTYASLSRAVAVGHVATGNSPGFTFRVYMGGVLVGSLASSLYTLHIVMGTRALSGVQECKLSAYCNTTGNLDIYNRDDGGSGAAITATIAVGSIKV